MTEEPGDWRAHIPQRRPWHQRVPRGPRADRQLREITVQLPPRIGELSYDLSGEDNRPLRAMVDSAQSGLAALDRTHGRRLKALNQLLLRTESVASSKIENIEASLADYGRAMLGTGANASATSMADATAALVEIIDVADRTGRITRDCLTDAHRALFRRHPEEHERAGSFRTVQNWIGGSDYTPRNALFVPPPPETVDDYLDDLLDFANREDLPPLVQAAIVHAQFESIHPFIDGNGRIGRTLIHAVLRRRKATRHLTVPIASGLVAHRENYFEALNDYRRGRAYTLIAMLASATTIAVHESRRTATNLHLIRRDWQEALGDIRPGTALFGVLAALPAEPIVTTARLAEHLGLSFDEVARAVVRLREAEILVPLAGRRRESIWGAQDILDELRDLNSRIEAVSRSKGGEAE